MRCFPHQLNAISKIKIDLIIGLFLSAAILGVYGQVSSHSFIDFDDRDYVVGNSYVRMGISSESIAWAFHFTQKGDKTYWHPLTWLSHMLDYQFFGLKAGRHHLINVLYHILNTLLLYLAFRKMTGEPWKSAFVASLFALHPINVDTVAWIAERKNVLSTFFWMLTMLAYIDYVKNRRAAKYFLVVSLFILGLLSKPMLVTLPFVLLLMDYWPLKRVRVVFPEQVSAKGKQAPRISIQGAAVSRLIVEKVPLLIFALVYIVIFSSSIREGSFQVDAMRVPMGLRLENALVSYLLYLDKLIWPANLTFFYPYPAFIPLWQVAGAVLILALVSAIALRFMFRAPYLLVGWLWFAGTLVPVSGIMQGGLWPQIAERWAYVPFIGLFIMLAWGIPDVLREFRYKREVLAASAVMVLSILMVVTWRQTGFWKDDITFFSHGVILDEQNYVAHTNLALAYATQGKKEEAIYHCKEAIRMHANDVVALNSLGKIYNQFGDQEKSIEYYSEAIKCKPDNVFALYNLGLIYAKRGDIIKAINLFSQVIKLDPDYEMAYYNMGISYAKKGEKDKAKEYLLSALKLNPDAAETHYYLGVVLMNQGKVNDSIGHLNEALKIDPGFKKAIKYKKSALIYKKKIEEDILKLEKERVEQPGNTGILRELAVLYVNKGENAEAIELLHQVVDIQPDNPDGYYNIACIHAKQGEVDESIAWLKKAIDKGFKNWILLKNDEDLVNIRTNAYYKKLIEKNRG